MLVFTASQARVRLLQMLAFSLKKTPGVIGRSRKVTESGSPKTIKPFLLARLKKRQIMVMAAGLAEPFMDSMLSVWSDVLLN